MCDYDFTYEEISHRTVKTRKPHECGSCMQVYPAGTMMQYAVGVTDGDIGATYACQACLFGLRQPDHGPLHLCWGHGWDGGDVHAEKAHEYISDCLAKGETPTDAGLKVWLDHHRELEEA